MMLLVRSTTLLLVGATFLLQVSDALIAPRLSLKQRASRRSSHDSFPSHLHAKDDTASTLDFWNSSQGGISPKKIPACLEWVSIGLSSVYLAHFASLYTQLPGLFGQSGLLPIADRISNLDDRLWALHQIMPPELGMEAFAALGILVSAAQLVYPQLRRGIAGVLTYGMQWLFWHDLVVAGGRLMAYQMDILLLDAAPISLLAASGLSPQAAIFGYRWLLARLYLGAGAVKLLSCDESWRGLSAVHVHFQSQPLPNPLGAAAYLHLPDSITHPVTLAVLVVEMAAPYLFLAPSRTVRRFAFVLNALLMAGIAAFGNFGPLQAVLVVIGFALLDDLPPQGGAESDSRKQSDEILSTANDLDDSATAATEMAVLAISAISVALAAAGGFWAVANVGARCLDTLAIEPLVYDLLLLGGVIASMPFFLPGGNAGSALASLVIFAGSAATVANGLGVYLPFNDAFEFLNFGAKPYGLFAIITGVNGRPVPLIEAAQSPDGPWTALPLLYQVNGPSSASSLPLCFPHFPRLDWTLWFIPNGETGAWIARLFHGVTVNDPSIVGLLDEPAFHQAFPNEPPAIVRVAPKTYELDPAEGGWLVTDDNPRHAESPVLAEFTRGDLSKWGIVEKRGAMPWPSLPVLRSLANTGRPEYFVWACLGTTEIVRRASSTDPLNNLTTADSNEDDKQ